MIVDFLWFFMEKKPKQIILDDLFEAHERLIREQHPPIMVKIIIQFVDFSERIVSQ